MAVEREIMELGIYEEVVKIRLEVATTDDLHVVEVFSIEEALEILTKCQPNNNFLADPKPPGSCNHRLHRAAKN
ncbi:MAG: hypothetical protein GY797_18165 [Deltaproteobacteria bacterium]|nr:hypothetical protein [Deltaproteobacteria bacterium]